MSEIDVSFLNKEDMQAFKMNALVSLYNAGIPGPLTAQQQQSTVRMHMAATCEKLRCHRNYHLVERVGQLHKLLASQHITTSCSQSFEVLRLAPLLALRAVFLGQMSSKDG